jgi:anthranilate synthase component 1
MITPSFNLFCEMAKEGNLIPVHQEIVADTETPVSAFIKIRTALPAGSTAFLLESVEGGEKWARYSFLGACPSIVIRGEGESVSVMEGGRQTIFHEPPLEVLQKTLARFRPVPMEGLPRFSGGAIGFIGYEGVRFFEPIQFKNRVGGDAPPDFFFLITDTLLIFDNLKQTIKVVANTFVEGTDLKAAYDQAVEKIRACIEQLESSAQVSMVPAVSANPQPLDGARSNVSKETFIASVEAAKQYIRAGDVFQTQISQRFSAPLETDPFLIYRALRRINPSPYMYYLQFDGLQVVGSSPEVLVRLEGRAVETRPIAGTRRRGKTPEEDRKMEVELLADPKERAEHIMLVDLSRNDIGRVCEYGSVQVNELMVIERYSHVMHIVSNVVGQLNQSEDAFSLLAACFPAGTVTGAPKIRAMEIINELEPEGRDLYAGTVGYIGFDGNMDTCITIRTAVICNGQITVQAAAGIVADSDPNLEYKETINKAKAMLSAIQMAKENATMGPPCC